MREIDQRVSHTSRFQCVDTVDQCRDAAACRLERIHCPIVAVLGKRPGEQEPPRKTSQSGFPLPCIIQETADVALVRGQIRRVSLEDLTNCVYTGGRLESRPEGLLNVLDAVDTKSITVECHVRIYEKDSALLVTSQPRQQAKGIYTYMLYVETILETHSFHIVRTSWLLRSKCQRFLVR